MTSGAVHRWNAEIQEGIFNMAELFIDMCVARLQHLPIHHEILNILTLVILYFFSNSVTVDQLLFMCQKYSGGLQESCYGNCPKMFLVYYFRNLKLFPPNQFISA